MPDRMPLSVALPEHVPEDLESVWGPQPEAVRSVFPHVILGVPSSPFTPRPLQVREADALEPPGKKSPEWLLPTSASRCAPHRPGLQPHRLAVPAARPR